MHDYIYFFQKQINHFKETSVDQLNVLKLLQLIKFNLFKVLDASSFNIPKNFFSLLYNMYKINPESITMFLCSRQS